jgi:ER-bound oxygenase mpaB/B'/Rubber oxygenase, catalytic domain
MRGRVVDAQGDGSGSREQGPAERWSPSEFARLRQTTDPEIDQVVMAYHREHPELAEARDLVTSMIRELSQAKKDPHRFTREAIGQDGTWLTAALSIALAPPRWNPDPGLIREGQKVFADYGLYQASSLFFASLPMAYATIDGAEVLARVSDLATHDLTRRVAETGQMLLDVMGLRGDRGLQPGSTGYATAIGLRLMHSCVRILILDHQEPTPWPARFGPPANQELLLGTLLDFTLVTWEALARMGVVLKAADREANLHVWSYIGLLMGVEACRDGPLSLGDVQQISVGMRRLIGTSEAGERLMAALLTEMEDFMPLGWRKLPRSVVRWLFQDAPAPVNDVPDLLHVPPAPLWSMPLLASLRAVNQDSWLLGPLASLARGLMRRLGRHVLIGYADRYSDGQAPFRVPDELAKSWRIRTAPAARGARRLRRNIRHVVRAQGQRRAEPAQSRGGS